MTSRSVARRRGGEPDRFEHLRDPSRAEVGAEQLGDAAGPHPHRRAGRQGAGRHRGAVLERGTEQLREALHREVDDLRVGALLEPGRGLRAELVAPRGLHDPDRVEPRHLEQDVGGGVIDLAGRAAHDPGQTNGHIVAVTDEQVLGA